MISSRIAFVLPSVVGALVVGAAITGAVIVDTHVLGLLAPPDRAPSPELDRVDVPIRELQTFPPTAVAMPAIAPSETWCSTKIPPANKDTARGSELFLVEGTLVVRTTLEGGDAILREAPGGYCMLFGPSPHLEVTTVGSWIVFTRDEPGGAGLYRMRIDGQPFERVATLPSMPVGVHGFDRQVGVEYVRAGLGGSLAADNTLPGQLFEIMEEPGGIEVVGLGDAYDTKRAVEALSYTRRRDVYTDGTIARLRLGNGREKIVAARGAQICTLVEAGAKLAMARFSGWVYYVRDRVLWRVPIDGGTAQRVRRVPSQPDWLSGRNGDLEGWHEEDDHPRWRASVGDGSPEASDKSGTSCDP